MTTETIEVETVETSQIAICDHCGLSEDDVDDEPLIRYRPQPEHAGVGVNLHFHPSCLDKMSATGEFSRTKVVYPRKELGFKMYVTVVGLTLIILSLETINGAIAFAGVGVGFALAVAPWLIDDEFEEDGD